MIASFHLTRYRSPGAMRHAALDRPALAAVRGLRFWRLLGTGRGSSLSLGADLHRWALFAVWTDDDAVEEFLAAHTIPARWRDEGVETWSVRLRPLGGHGRWGGVAPLGDPVAAPGAERPVTAHDAHAPDPAPVAILTRASIRLTRLARFHRAAPGVDRDLSTRPGCLRAVGVGEWPLLRQGTFSVWCDEASATAFAYRDRPHREVVRRTRAEGWYAEELFVRFRPYGSAGCWNGADPLAPG